MSVNLISKDVNKDASPLKRQEPFMAKYKRDMCLYCSGNSGICIPREPLENSYSLTSYNCALGAGVTSPGKIEKLETKDKNLLMFFTSFVPGK